jgi:hypothetical protein
MAWWTEAEQGADPYGIWGARKQGVDLFKKKTSQQGGTNFLSLLSNLAKAGGEESGASWTGLTGQGGIQDKMVAATAEEEARTAFQAKQLELQAQSQEEEKKRWAQQWEDYQKSKPGFWDKFAQSGMGLAQLIAKIWGAG